MELYTSRPPDPPHSSTGSGKTAMFTSLVHHLPPRIHPVTKEHATRVLILVSSIQLAQQTAAVVQRSWPNLVRVLFFIPTNETDPEW